MARHGRKEVASERAKDIDRLVVNSSSNKQKPQLGICGIFLFAKALAGGTLETNTTEGVCSLDKLTRQLSPSAHLKSMDTIVEIRWQTAKRLSGHSCECQYARWLSVPSEEGVQMAENLLFGPIFTRQ